MFWLRNKRINFLITLFLVACVRLRLVLAITSGLCDNFQFILVCWLISDLLKVIFGILDSPCRDIKLTTFINS